MCKTKTRPLADRMSEELEAFARRTGDEWGTRLLAVYRNLDTDELVIEVISPRLGKSMWPESNVSFAILIQQWQDNYCRVMDVDEI